MSVVAVVLYWIPIRGADGTDALAVHGEAVPLGAHTPPFGKMALAVFVSVHGGEALTVAVIVYVKTPQTGNVAFVSVIAPLPLAFGQTAPPEPAQVHANAVNPIGNGSLLTETSAATLPTLLAVTV